MHHEPRQNTTPGDTSIYSSFLVTLSTHYSFIHALTLSLAICILLDDVLNSKELKNTRIVPLMLILSMILTLHTPDPAPRNCFQSVVADFLEASLLLSGGMCRYQPAVSLESSLLIWALQCKASSSLRCCTLRRPKRARWETITSQLST